jgi:hypothetical protein
VQVAADASTGRLAFHFRSRPAIIARSADATRRLYANAEDDTSDEEDEFYGHEDTLLRRMRYPLRPLASKSSQSRHRLISRKRRLRPVSGLPGRML